MVYTTPPTKAAGNTLTDTEWNTTIRDSMEDLAKPPRAKVNRNTNQSIPNNAVTTLVWQNEDYDTGLWTPGVPTAFVIPASMDNTFIMLGLTAQFAINGTGGRFFAIQRNGVNLATSHDTGSASWFSGDPITIQHYCFTGDLFSAVAYQNSGGPLNVDITYPVAFWICQISR